MGFRGDQWEHLLRIGKNVRRIESADLFRQKAQDGIRRGTHGADNFLTTPIALYWFQKTSFPSPLYSGIAEIHSFAMIHDLPNLRPRLPTS